MPVMSPNCVGVVPEMKLVLKLIPANSDMLPISVGIVPEMELEFRVKSVSTIDRRPICVGIAPTMLFMLMKK